MIILSKKKIQPEQIIFIKMWVNIGNIKMLGLKKIIHTCNLDIYNADTKISLSNHFLIKLENVEVKKPIWILNMTITKKIRKLMFYG